jgi:type II secretory pathway component GspD/PulD (secretin)
VYRNLRAVIDQLDVRRAQVYIESLIVEVTSDKASEFGVQWVGATGNSNSTYRVGGLQSFTTGGTNNAGALPQAGATLPTTACRSASSSRSAARWDWARWRTRWNRTATPTSCRRRT